MCKLWKAMQLKSFETPPRATEQKEIAKMKTTKEPTKQKTDRRTDGQTIS